MPIHREVEVKCRVSDLAGLRRKLKKLQARPAPPASTFTNKKTADRGDFRVHEMNFLFDTPEGGLAKHGQLLRIRVESLDNSTKKRQHDRPEVLRRMFTYKGPSFGANSTSTTSTPRENVSFGSAMGHLVPAGRHKVREEIEVEIADDTGLKHILEALGMRAWFRYEKFRTTYRLPSSARWAKDLSIELDETPIGIFVELEGPPDSIERAAQLLGYAPRNYITQSYLALHLERCKAMKLPPHDMLFPLQK
jgi:adenylate cyclase class IV